MIDISPGPKKHRGVKRAPVLHFDYDADQHVVVLPLVSHDAPQHGIARE